MKTLTTSPVIFNEQEHTYTLNGNHLSGITPIVGWMFPMTYAGIPQETLDRAAAYGKDVHRRCNLLDLYHIEDDNPHVKDYADLKTANQLTAQKCEYIISDGKRVASAIDVVFTDKDGDVVLGDIKTTSKINIENVTLQLNLYVYLFERMNPELKAKRLLVVWLPKPQYGHATIMDCKRISDDLCERIIEAYTKGEDPASLRVEFYGAIGFQVTHNDTTLPDNLREVEESIVSMEQAIKEMKEKSDQLKKGLLELMQMHDVKKWEGEQIILTRKLPSIRLVLDTAKVKEKFPDAYYECLKESATGESLTIKIK